jgi:hypothetical protein
MKTHAQHPADAVRKGPAREAETHLRLEYVAPRIVEFGEACELIQGYWDEGWADWADHYKHSNELFLP